MSILTVGSGQQFARLSDAIAASRDGDVIRAQAGTYVNDFAIITTRISIEGVGGMVNLVATQPPPNGKVILTTTTDVTLDHVALSGATSSSGNGAGIRHENGALTLNYVYIHDNQDGILAGDGPNNSITITNSEFAFNGAGDGQTHGIYVNQIQQLTIRDSYFHDTSVGHEIKSRAYNTLIENSRIMSGPTGTDSYAVDLPNGGAAVLRNNVIVEGAQSQNPNTIDYGGEAGPLAGSSLLLSGNTFINDRSNANLLRSVSGVTATLSDNRTFGYSSNQITQGPANISGTIVLATRPAVDTSAISFGASSQPAPVPAPVPVPVPVASTGPDTLVLNLSEDAYQGNAQFVALMDGVELAAAQQVTALHGSGQSQAFTFNGSFGSGAHTVGVRFLNDAWGGSPAADRNLYVDSVAFNGTQYPDAKANLFSAGVANFNVGTAAEVPVATIPPVGSGPDTLVLNLSEDAYQGNAEFTVTVDGNQIGGSQQVTALHGSGQSQAFTFNGSFGSGTHTVGVRFLTDAWGGSPAADRNLYVDSIAFNGTQYPNAKANLFSAGVANFNVGTAAAVPVATTLPVGSGPDTLVLNLSEDAYQGNAEFTVTVDGNQIGAAQQVTALHGSGQSQAFTFNGSFGSGVHTVGVRFLNDAWGGSPAADRNLYVDSIAFNGTQYPNAKANLLSSGVSNFNVGTAVPVTSFTPVPAASSNPAVQPGSYTLEGPAWSARPITWSFGTKTYAQDASNPFSNSIGGAYQATIQQAMQTWASASGLTFQQVADSPDANGAAAIRIGFADLNAPATNVVGATSYRYSLSGSNTQTFLPDVVVRLQDPSKVPLAPGSNGGLQYQGFSTTLYQVALHEIGHALGLGHSNDATSVMYPSLGAQDPTLNASDIAGIRSLYGAPSGTQMASAQASSAPSFPAASAPGDAVLHDEQGSYVSIDGRQFGGALTAEDYDALGLSGNLAFSGRFYSDAWSVQPEAGEGLLAGTAISPWQDNAAAGLPVGSESAGYALHDQAPASTLGIMAGTDYTMGQVLPILHAA